MYKRAEYQVITGRLKEPEKFIQVVMGARQVGKSTVVKQVPKIWTCLISSFLPTTFRPRRVRGFQIAGQLCAA